jgi:ABC-2 type transport system permease protein
MNPVLDTPGRPSLTTLTLVELRKMTDTRSGRWLLGLVVILGTAVVVLVLSAAPRAERTTLQLIDASHTGVDVLVPILGAMLMTAEFSQRTALTTFALVPDRRRVVAAKLLATIAVAVAAVLVCALVGLAGRAVGGALGRAEGGWTVSAAALGGMVVAVVVGAVMGTLYGLVFLNTPLAIVLMFIVPGGVSTAAATVHALKAPARWLDPTDTLPPLAKGELHGQQWAQLATSLALWILLPLAFGLLRLSRRELK